MTTNVSPADMADTTSRQQPWDELAEMAVLGAVIAYPRELAEVVATGITGNEFYLPAHEAIWDAVNTLANQGAPFDVPAVTAELLRTGGARSLPNRVYVFDLMQGASPAGAAYHAKTVRDFAARRRGIAAAQQIMQISYAPDVSAVEVQSIAESLVANIGAPIDESTWSTLDDVMRSVRERYDETRRNGVPDGIRWGYSDVDAVMTPMQPGDFAVIIAWAGGGKSVVAANLAIDVAVKQGLPALVHSMEMTRLEIGQRYAAKTGGLQLNDIIAGSLTPAQEDHLDWAIAQLAGAPLVVDEAESMTLSRLRASIRKHKPKVVIVDQIPIMLPEDSRASREQQVSSLAYGLKRLAAAEKVVIVACSQLNSEPMKRSAKKPTLQDIRESRAIGQAANVVVMLHDPTVGEEDPTRLGEIDWIVEKQRQGRKATIPLAQQFHYSRLSDMA